MGGLAAPSTAATVRALTDAPRWQWHEAWLAEAAGRGRALKAAHPAVLAPPAQRVLALWQPDDPAVLRVARSAGSVRDAFQMLRGIPAAEVERMQASLAGAEQSAGWALAAMVVTMDSSTAMLPLISASVDKPSQPAGRPHVAAAVLAAWGVVRPGAARWGRGGWRASWRGRRVRPSSHSMSPCRRRARRQRWSGSGTSCCTARPQGRRPPGWASCWCAS